MRKLLLSSTGFSNRSFEKLFLAQVNKPAEQIKAIFVPTAAVFDDAREVLPDCMRDLTDAGILPENIMVYHLGYVMSCDHPRAYAAGKKDIPYIFRLLSLDEMLRYDAIYFCGGDPTHLLNEVNRTGFHKVLKQAVEDGIFYIGVSAGSIIAAGNLSDNLGYIKNELAVHCENGTASGGLPENDKVFLTDAQAIWINGNAIEIID